MKKYEATSNILKAIICFRLFHDCSRCVFARFFKVLHLTIIVCSFELKAAVADKSRRLLRHMQRRLGDSRLSAGLPRFAVSLLQIFDFCKALVKSVMRGRLSMSTRGENRLKTDCRAGYQALCVLQCFCWPDPVGFGAGPIRLLLWCSPLGFL